MSNPAIQNITTFLYVTIRSATPFLLVGFSAVICQQTGLRNLSIESMALIAALVGVLVSGYTQSLLLALVCAIASSAIVALILCYAAFYLKVNLSLMSIALNTAISGSTILTMFLLTGSKANTSTSIPSLVFPEIEIPIIKDIPVLGDVLSGHNILTYVALLMIVVVWFLVYKTTLGLRLRAIGRNPDAAETAGLNVRQLRTTAFVFSAVVASLCGVFMSMAYVQWFARDMIAGRGFIGMSAATIANASPVGTALASFTFTLAYVVNNYLRLQNIDAQIISAIPYILTIILLDLFGAIRYIREKNASKKNMERQ